MNQSEQIVHSNDNVGHFAVTLKEGKGILIGGVIEVRLSRIKTMTTAVISIEAPRDIQIKIIK